MTLHTRSPQSAPVPETVPPDPRRQVDWRRLRSPGAIGALVALFVAAVGASLGTVVAGRLAERPSAHLVGWLGLCLVGSAALIAAAQTVWVANSDRAEGRLREDLLDAALAQPLAVLSEQAVGEILDRVDDDTHEVGNLVRWNVWQLCRTVFGVVPMWLVAGVTWWPAFLLFPTLAAATWLAVRRPLVRIKERKVVEEAAWTDHAAAMEEGIAGRDDLRTSLGQPHVIARLAALSARVHRKFAAVARLESSVVLRAGLLLHALLAGVAVAGVALVEADSLSVASLVTLFLVTTSFVGEVNMLANHLPDLQAGLGAVLRLRQMTALAPEPTGGRPLSSTTAPGVEFRGLTFAYPGAEDGFALRDVDLLVPGGETMALVGRSGSGKSTLAAFLSRAVDPPPGTVLLDGVDVLDLDLQQLRSAVGVVTQRTEIIAGTLAENITLFEPGLDAAARAAVAQLGLTDWVRGLPDGLSTRLGAGGLKLSAGEEQLVAFARLLVREVRVVVLDEATARMDPLTEHRVVRASEALLAGRTGILVAHRLSTIERAPWVTVLSRGSVVQSGTHEQLATAPGPFADLVTAARAARTAPESAEGTSTAAAPVAGSAVGSPRRQGEPPVRPSVGSGPSLAAGVRHALAVRPLWGALGAVEFALFSFFGALGAVTGLVWGLVVEDLQAGRTPQLLVGALVACLLVAPVVFADAVWRYPRWWVDVLLRVRMQVLAGQTAQRRLPSTPPGEVVARAMDADRFVKYADRWVDFVTGMLIAGLTAVLAGTWVAGAVLLAVLAVSAVASTVGRPVAGRSAAASSTARAGFGRALVSVLDAVRTVKLAAATPALRAHLRDVDRGRVAAAVREHRVQAVLDGVPRVLVQSGVVTAWAMYARDDWSLATTLLVANAVAGFDWFGRVAGMVVSEAPGTRAWQAETARFAGGVDLVDLPEGVDLLTGRAPEPEPVPRVPLSQVQLTGFSAVHDDGTIGVEEVDLRVGRGELVLLLGQVGSGKSSLLAGLAGLLEHRGAVHWNGEEVDDPELFLRPGQVAHVAQVPRVLSGSFADNVLLGHERKFDEPVAAAQLEPDLADAGGREALVGHRGVRLSGGQVQRLALARALAADAELLLADDVSSALDATTEVHLWASLRERGSTVLGATSKRAALEVADRVVVLVDGRIADQGTWQQLAPRWWHLAG